MLSSKGSYGLVECIFTTSPNFSDEHLNVFHSFSEKDKKINFYSTNISHQDVPLDRFK